MERDLASYLTTADEALVMAAFYEFTKIVWKELVSNLFDRFRAQYWQLVELTGVESSLNGVILRPLVVSASVLS